MAFKAESDDTRSSLTYKLKRILRFKAPATCSCTDPYVDDRPDLRAARATCSAEADLLVDRDAAPRVRATSTIDKPVVDMWNLLGRARRERRVTPRVSVVIPVYNEGDDIVPCSTGSSRRSRCRARSLVVFDSPDDTTVPVRSRSTPSASRRRAAGAQHLRPRAGQRDPLRHRPGATRRSSWSRWPTAATTRARSTTLARLVERGVVVAAASRYMPRRPAGRRPAAQGAAVAAGRAHRCTGSPGSAPATRPTRSRRTTAVRRARSASTADAGFEIGLELIAKARRLRLPGGRDPDDLARPARRRVELQAARSGCPTTCAGTASPSARRLDARAARRHDDAPTDTATTQIAS